MWLVATILHSASVDMKLLFKDAIVALRLI